MSSPEIMMSKGAASTNATPTPRGTASTSRIVTGMTSVAFRRLDSLEESGVAFRALLLAVALMLLPFSAALAQVAQPPTPRASAVVGEASAAATVTVPGGRLIEIAGLRENSIQLPLGVDRHEVDHLLGNPLYTSLLQKAEIIDFDDRGRLVLGSAAQTRPSDPQKEEGSGSLTL